MGSNRARGIIWAGYHNVRNIAFCRTRQHRFLVNGKVGLARNVNDFRVIQARIERIHGKRGRDIDHLAAGASVRQRNIEQQFIATVT